MITSRARMLAWTRPLGPIVTLLSCDSIVPSTSPSTYRSSLVKIWPMILTAFPIVAEFRASVSGVRNEVDDTGVGSFLISGNGGAGTGGALAGRGAGGSSRLFHMLI